jgi:hypothetical protein
VSRLALTRPPHTTSSSPPRDQEEELPPIALDLPLKELKARVVAAREAVSLATAERAQVAVDRDAVAGFLEVAQRELRAVELEALAKERARTDAADAHAIEVRVYEQKVKHLTFEHANASRAIAGEADSERAAESRAHQVREALLRKSKGEARARLVELEGANADALRTQKVLAEKSLQKIRADFDGALDGLRVKYEARCASLARDLELRARVELHEAEERRNLHIRQLSVAHEEAFAEMRAYYNDVTRANMELVTGLRARIVGAGEKATANQRLVLEIAEENKRLSEPLRVALQERAELVADLKDASRDASALAHSRERLGALRASLTTMKAKHADLEARFAAAAAERDALYDRFETTVRAAAARAAERADALEVRLEEAENVAAAANAAAAAVVTAGALDPGALAAASDRLTAELEARNGAIRELQGAVLRLTKGRDEAVRTLTAKLVDLGIPADVVADGLPPANALAESVFSSVLESAAAYDGPAGIIVAQKTGF